MSVSKLNKARFSCATLDKMYWHCNICGDKHLVGDSHSESVRFKKQKPKLLPDEKPWSPYKANP